MSAGTPKSWEDRTLLGGEGREPTNILYVAVKFPATEPDDEIAAQLDAFCQAVMQKSSYSKIFCNLCALLLL